MTVALDIEITALTRCLQGEREHTLAARGRPQRRGAAAPQLPSGWSCLGMMQHLTLSVERLYFRAVTAGDPEVIEQPSRQGWVPTTVKSRHLSVCTRYRRPKLNHGGNTAMASSSGTSRGSDKRSRLPRIVIRQPPAASTFFTQSDCAPKFAPTATTPARLNARTGVCRTFPDRRPTCSRTTSEPNPPAKRSAIGLTQRWNGCVNEGHGMRITSPPS